MLARQSVQDGEVQVDMDRTVARSTPELVVPGTVLDGRFRVDALLARGGMGCVYAAWHLGLEEPVALKLLVPDRALDDRSRARLVREARTAAKVKSEHVVRVIDVVGS